MKKLNYVLLGIVLIPFILIIMDILNVTHIIHLTSNYDWLAFIGAYISGLCTIILGIVSIKQNKTLSDVNERMLTNNMITTRFSQIVLEQYHYYDSRIREYSGSEYGIKMVADDCVDESKLICNRIILQLTDKNGLPLKYGKIDSIEVYTTPWVEECKRIYKSGGLEVELEAITRDDKITYFLPICILDDEKHLKAIFDSRKLMIVATIYVKNAFNVVSEANYTMHIEKSGGPIEWVKYCLSYKKIYFKEITFDDEKRS